MLLTLNAGNSAVLVLLDLTVGFDTPNHNLLLSQLEMGAI